MSFWRFGFAQQSAIDTLLSSLPASGPGTPQYDGSVSSGDESSSGAALPSVTLEQLLEEDDLLQECKNGHNKLVRCINR